MSWIGRLFRRSSMERQLDKELRFHIEEHTEALTKRGYTPAEARRRALVELGGAEQVKEECREARGVQFWEHIRQDSRYAFRSFLKSPGFTVVAIVTLALGIGANTAVFSAVYTLLLKPLPYSHPDRLVYLWARQPARGIPELPICIPDYLDFKKQLKSFDVIAGYWSSEFAIGGVAHPKRVPALRVFSDYFRVLQLPPLLGRTLEATDEVWGHHRVAMLSEGLWRSMFGADPNIVGRTIMMDAVPYEVVGVMPGAATALNPRVQVWTPIALPPNTPLGRLDRFMRVIGRVAPGASRETAAAELATVMAALGNTYEEDRGISTYLVPVTNEITTPATRRELFVLLGAVGMLLLIACINIANLVAVRATGRECEFAVRAALGASRERLIQQLTTEHLLLALAGGAVAIAFAYWAVAQIRAFGAAQVPRAELISIEWPVLGFAFMLTILTGVLFGILPARKASRLRLGALQHGTRLANTRGGMRSRKLLIVTETALSLALLICAGLLISSFLRLQAVDPGFGTDRTLVAEIVLPRVNYREDQRRIEFFDQLLRRARTLPGVIAAGASETLPLQSGNQTWTGFEREGFPAGGLDKMPTVAFAHVTPGYFGAMRIPVLLGREFNEHDDPKSQSVAVISETLKRRFFGGDTPLGKRIRLNADSGEPWLTIVGVVGDVSLEALDRPQPPYVYTPFDQGLHGVGSDLLLVLHTNGNPLSLVSALREQVKEIDRNLPIADVTTNEKIVNTSLDESRATTVLMFVFAAAAVLLAAVGIYGVLAYTVSQRAKEIGIRLALGASASEVLALIVGEGMRTSLIGIVIGLGLAFAASRALAALLFHVAALDPRTYVGSVLVMLAIASLAALFPAIRASHTDPVVALRQE